MRILAVHSALAADPVKQSQVDHWRIYRPLRELAKHVDWQIDHLPTFIPGFEKYKNLEEFTPEEMEKAFKVVCGYDIVFSSYHADAAAYTMLKVAADKAGTQFIMDMDDNIFSVNEDNPFWMKMNDHKAWILQVMARENKWITTTTEFLADELRKRRQKPPDDHPADSVIVLPNYISDDYQHPKFEHKDEVVIGYFGGSSHYDDVHETGVGLALQKLMHENKQIRFKAVGMPLETYVPRGRYEFEQGKRGTLWLKEVFPYLEMDIAIGPLYDNVFNWGKSDIKWQEATRAGAAFVASNIGPYTKLPKATLSLAENTTESWYTKLKQLVEKAELRKSLLRSSRKELELRRLEINWPKYRELFERVKNVQRHSTLLSTHNK